jgi:membrane protein implicated in regulation of membrane protease activity
LKRLSDGGWLFLGSVLLVVLSLAGSGWLVASGQVMGLDGLFMLLVFLTTALVFALYAWNLLAIVRDQIETERSPKPAGRKTPAAQP